MRRSASLSSCALLILAACAGKTGDDDGGDDTAGEAGASAAPTVQIGRPVADTDHSETEPLVFEASVSDDEDAPDALVLSWTDASGAVLGSSSHMSCKKIPMKNDRKVIRRSADGKT